MRVAIIGAGPTGLVLAGGLARRGHDVVVVDRDAGPEADGTWTRRGVMQFHHAHAFRPQVVQVLRDECPAAYDAWLASGAEPVELPVPGQGTITAMRSRRSTFERAVRPIVATQPGVEIRRGHVDAVPVEGRRALGLVVDGELLPADLVVDASGRGGRVTRDLRAEPAVGGPCGIAYVDRQYQLHPGAELGPLLNPLAWQGEYDGYQVILFVHEHGIFSVLFVRPIDDPDLRLLRHADAFDAACRAVPGLAVWTDPARSRPITEVLPGGPLVNYYRSQRGPDGRLVADNLLFIGDSVCTTTPNFGRGVATSLLQVQHALRLLDDGVPDLVGAFDAWADEQMRPWVEDHVHIDTAQARRWSGEDVDLSRPLPSDLIMRASESGPEAGAAIGPAIGPYMALIALPTTLAAVEPVAREVYAGGWRPPYAPGPTRAELTEVIRGALASVTA